MKKTSLIFLSTTVALLTQGVNTLANESLSNQIDVPESQSAQEVLNEQFQSSVTIRQSGTSTVKEYRTQGKTYKLEVDPNDSPAYSLSDQDGNGNIESTNTNISSDVVVPEWTIGTW